LLQNLDLDGSREVGESAALPLFREFTTPGGMLTPAAINSKLVISPEEFGKSKI